MQFTIGAPAHEDFRRLQALLRREIPDGDPGAIVERALSLLLEKVEKTKLAAVAKAQPNPSIRPGTDIVHKSPVPSRHIPRGVKRAVWSRDAGQCGFETPSGRRCSERVFLEFHHIQPYARRGPATIANIALRCRRHNQYEAELEFGPRGAG
jgi:5-methylcytosine-specific restriction endonuclease McrA